MSSISWSTRAGWSAAALIALAVPGPAGLVAQDPSTGSLSGRIVDNRGVPVPDATITISRADGTTARIVQGEVGGQLLAQQLPAGRYAVLAEQVGYQPVRMRGIEVLAGHRTDVTIRLERRPPPVAAPVEVMYAGLGPVVEGTIIPIDLVRSLDRTGSATDAARSTSQLLAAPDEDGWGLLAGNGLPPAFGQLRVDGIEETTVRHPGLPAVGSEAPLFTATSISQAIVAPFTTDASFPGAAGPSLILASRTGHGRAHFTPYGTWSGTLGIAAEDNPADSSASSYRVGLVAGGSSKGDSLSWGLRVEYRHLLSPTAAPSTVAGSDVRFADAAGAEDVARWTSPTVRSWDGVVGNATLGWQLSPSAAAMLRFGAGSWTEDNPAVPGVLSNNAGLGLTARDISAMAQVTLSGETWSSVTRLGVQSHRREWVGDGLPYTSVVSDGAAIGIAPMLPGLFRDRTVTANEAVTLPSGDHEFQVGASVAQRRINYDWLFDGAGRFDAGSYDDLGMQRGRWAASEAASPAPDVDVLTAAAFLQDTWRPGSGLEVTAGIRYQHESLPDALTVSSPTVERLFGLRTNLVPSTRAGAVGPRLGLAWDPGSRGTTRVTLSGGLVPGHYDLAALAEAARYDGSVTVSRALGSIGWPAPVEPVLESAPVTFLDADARAPRTATFVGGLTQVLGVGTTLSLSGGYSHTDYLLRRADINLPVAPLATLADGRPVWGALEQLGGLVAAEPGTNRRFDELDHVWGLSPTGYAEQYHATVSLRHESSQGWWLAAGYTWSRTRDNMLGQLSADPADRIAPLATDGTSGGWDDGISDLDVPHRVVATLGYTAPDGEGFRALARWRWQSGLPFTPGFRRGVDVNGDGSGGNDPVALGSVSGLDALLSDAGCAAGSEAFAARNSCRADAIQRLDAEVGYRFLLGGSRGLTLSVSGFNLAGTASGVVDQAALLVDPTRSTGTDSQGRLTVPLMLNDHFGQLLARQGAPRIIRFGLRLEN